MNFDEIIEKRKSIRAYTSDPIPAEALEAVLKAGIMAPSARNLQNLKFIVVNDRSFRRTRLWMRATVRRWSERRLSL